MNKRKRHLRRLALLLMVLMVMVFTSETVHDARADVPYKTYTVDGNGSVSETQTAYLPYKTITKIGSESLTAPTDFTLMEDGSMYILDSGKKRVVVSDPDAELVMTFGEGTLVKPVGMYVTKDRITYVADRDAAKIFVFDETGKLIHSYGRPTEPLYGETQDFKPLKIVVNDAGTMYVICESNTNGIVQISPVEDGTFLGYFGTNATNASLWNIIWRSLMTSEQRAKMVGNIPATPDNMAIDEKGLIYTVTRGEKSGSLKRLNIAGTNMLVPEAYEEIPAAVAVGNHDNVFVVSQQGYIYEYNNEGNLLFVFGGSDNGEQRIGLSTKVEAIQIGKDDKIYTLDSDKGVIQVYTTTEFTEYLHDALYLFSKGRYEESKAPLSEVLKMNNLYDYANMAMGRAMYKENNFDAALSYAKLAKDRDGYSDAFWEIRNNWLKKNLGWFIILLVVLFIAIKVLGLLDHAFGILAKPKEALKKAGEKKLVSQLKYIFYFVRHPINACYEIKWMNKVSVKSANIFVVLFMVFFIINKYFCGFLTKTVREGSYDIISDIGIVLLVLFLLVGANYLMVTINDGEGRLKHVYCTFVYCAGPYFMLMPLIFILSHVVTYNELFFIQLAYVIMAVWITSLVIISIREVNDYSVKKTLQIIFLTAFTILIVCMLAFIVYVLWAQVFEFMSSLIGEVVYRIGR